MPERIFVDGPQFPSWTEVRCGICWERLMEHTLKQLRGCAIKSGRRLGETNDYFLPAILRVHVGPTGDLTETQEHFYEGTCPTCGKKTFDHTLDQFKECVAKARPQEGS
jgi:hypothetical protein